MGKPERKCGTCNMPSNGKPMVRPKGSRVWYHIGHEPGAKPFGDASRNRRKANINIRVRAGLL